MPLLPCCGCGCRSASSPRRQDNSQSDGPVQVDILDVQSTSVQLGFCRPLGLRRGRAPLRKEAPLELRHLEVQVVGGPSSDFLGARRARVEAPAGAKRAVHSITGLQPDTEYSIAICCAAPPRQSSSSNNNNNSSNNNNNNQNNNSFSSRAFQPAQRPRSDSRGLLLHRSLSPTASISSSAHGSDDGGAKGKHRQGCRSSSSGGSNNNSNNNSNNSSSNNNSTVLVRLELRTAAASPSSCSSAAPDLSPARKCSQDSKGKPPKGGEKTSRSGGPGRASDDVSTIASDGAGLGWESLGEADFGPDLGEDCNWESAFHPSPREPAEGGLDLDDLGQEGAAESLSDLPVVEEFSNTEKAQCSLCSMFDCLSQQPQSLGAFKEVGEFNAEVMTHQLGQSSRSRQQSAGSQLLQERWQQQQQQPQQSRYPRATAEDLRRQSHSRQAFQGHRIPFPGEPVNAAVCGLEKLERQNQAVMAIRLEELYRLEGSENSSQTRAIV